MKTLIILPVIVPFATAVILLLAQRWQKSQWTISMIGAAAQLTIAILLLKFVREEGIQAIQIGNWEAPFGISFVVDLLGAIMVVLAALMGLSVTIYSYADIDAKRQSFGYFALLNILQMGVCGAFLTGDAFNLYVWFEVMLMSSFVLMVLGGEQAQMEGGVKYVTLNLLSSALFLTGLGILYGEVGTLNMADLAVKLSQSPHSNLINITAMLFFSAFGIKAAIFPLFFWLPASYHTPPAAASAIFAGLLTKVGVYALIRSFTLFFTQDASSNHTLILILAGLTMVTGVLGAASQFEFRRILSFHIISQIGYMIMGLGLFTGLALAGSVLYLIHHIVVKTNLFLLSGVVDRLMGTYNLKKLGGLYQTYPLLALLFIIPAFSLAGIPPLSGFWAKFILVKAGLETGQYFIVFIALIVSILTLYSMTKIWNEAFWKKAPATPSDVAYEHKLNLSKLDCASLVLPIVLLALITFCIGLYPEPFIALAQRTAEQLINPSE
ncbi:MAG: Na+/H+ antiporter subunit D, partial [candidate division KSB1 bacterium]|nr:Na+/H+ antiporter subunit D [candidate division KSB1 bacterium]